MNRQSFHLSDSDIEAILCALPLVLEIGADSPAQEALNTSCCTSAGEKLIAHSPNLSANEIRVISVAITAAVLLLSGKGAGFVPNIDSEWKAELSKHLFTLNRLDPIFQGFVDQCRM